MAIALLQDQLLAALFSQKGWDIRANLPHWLTLLVPKWADVAYVSEHYRASLAGCVAAGLPIYFEYGGCDRHVCQINQLGEIMDISLDGIVANRAMLDVFGEMLAFSDRSLGLVRLGDERQITVSGGADGAFLGSASRDDAQRLYRADYWHPGDLIQFNQDWRQSLSIDGNWLEYSYRSFILGGESQRLGRFDQRFTTRYKLLQGPRGEMYHYCENLGVEAIVRD